MRSSLLFVLTVSEMCHIDISIQQQQLACQIVWKNGPGWMPHWPSNRLKLHYAGVNTKTRIKLIEAVNFIPFKPGIYLSPLWGCSPPKISSVPQTLDPSDPGSTVPVWPTPPTQSITPPTSESCTNPWFKLCQLYQYICVSVCLSGCLPSRIAVCEVWTN